MLAAPQVTAGAFLATYQYLSGAITVAVLTLVLGQSPDQLDFRTALLAPPRGLRWEPPRSHSGGKPALSTDSGLPAKK